MSDGWTPLHVAALKGHVEMAEWLCEKDPSLLGKFNSDGQTPLHAAALKGHVEMAKWLCEKDPSLLGKYNHDGLTPLHLAAENGHLPIVKWICVSDPKQLFIKFNKNTPYNLAVAANQIEVAHWLKENFPDGCQ